MSSTGDPAQIREEIATTREELGETVEALAAKTDVVGQAKHKLGETRSSVSETADRVLGKVKEATPETAAGAAGQATRRARERPLPVVAAGAFAVGFLLGRVTSS